MTEWQKRILENIFEDEEKAVEIMKKNLDFFAKESKFEQYRASLIFNAELHPEDNKKYWHASVSFYKQERIIHPDQWSDKLQRKSGTLFAEALHGVGIEEAEKIVVIGQSLHIWKELTEEEYTMTEKGGEDG